MDGISFRRKDSRGEGAAVDLLDGNHIRVEFIRIAAEQGDILRLLRPHVGRKLMVAVRQPFEIPSRKLQFGGTGVRRYEEAKQQDKCRARHRDCFSTGAPSASASGYDVSWLARGASLFIARTGGSMR